MTGAEQGLQRGLGRGLALMAGGGSGGHVFPGLAVARELQARGWRVAWVGRPQSLESNLLAAQDGIDFHGLPALPLVGKNVLARVRGLAILAASAWRARSLVRRLDARVVVGTGGYASVPAVLGARLAGVPAVLLEPNAEAGAANRLLSRWSQEAVVAHDATSAGFRCPSTTTGVPVRSEFFDIAPNLPFGEPLRLLVLGGSQGARSVNEALPAAVASLRRQTLRAGAHGGKLFVRHQAGAHHADAAYERWSATGIETTRGSQTERSSWRPDGPDVQVQVVPFLGDVAAAMAESHLILSRAGAITLAEICAAGRPSLLLPLDLAGGHQEANARRLQDAGAAEVLMLRGSHPDSSGAALSMALGSVLADLLADRERLDAMAGSARGLGRRDAAGAIADRVEARALPKKRNGESSSALVTPSAKGRTA